MMEYLPQDLRDQLVAAHTAMKRKRATRAVHVNDEAFAILDMGDHGFAVAANEAPQLRGLVDIYQGSKHLYQALIVASAQDGDLMRYEFKRNTATARTAPVDFVQSDPYVAGLLTQAT